MKYNWAKVYKELKLITLANVGFEGVTAAESKDLAGYFALTVNHTDTFHPFDTDGDLQRQLHRMPNYCNYRNLESYWEYREQKSRIIDVLIEVYDEIQMLVNDHFADAWNFPPGYVKPKEITFKLEPWALAEKTAGRILRVAKS